MKSEEEIEIWVEMQIDRLDMKYSIGRLTEEEYKAAIKEVNEQAERFYANI